VIILQLAAVYIPGLAGVLGVVPLRARDWAIVLPAALLPAVAGQLVRLRGRGQTESRAQT
jgi:hypothetical protein